MLDLTCCPGWTADVFNDSDDAEADLCEDRASFLQQNPILELIPNHIRRRIMHRGENAQIEGFRELFILLNTDPDADELRRLIVVYFKNCPTLRGHLG